MSKQQLQADIADSVEEEFEESLTAEQAKKVQEDWEETLNSPESAAFLDSLIANAQEEIKSEKK